jgi:hypothetical protein
MRTTGTLEAAPGFGVPDHLCWSYDDAHVLRARTLEFLGEDLGRGLPTRVQAIRRFTSATSKAQTSRSLAKSMAVFNCSLNRLSNARSSPRGEGS